MDTVTAAHAATRLAASPHWGNGPPPFAPWGALMFCLLIVLALGALFFVARRRHGGGPPPWVQRPASPEEDARRTLADRFARGDITVEEFMERASALNWNPGTDEGQGRGRGRGRT